LLFQGIEMNLPIQIQQRSPEELQVPKKQALGKLLVVAVTLALLIGSWEGADMRPLELLGDAGHFVTSVASAFPPDFYEWRLYVQELLITLQIALWGTALAAICAVPMGFLCSSRITPWWIHQPARRLMGAACAINEIVFAMLFVLAVGLGPFAGVLALFLYSTGVLSKQFSKAFDEIQPQSAESILAAGAHPIRESIVGSLPQLMPVWISGALHRFESNVRSATVVGMVGAGGIGVILWEVIREFQYAKTCAVLLMIVLTVGVIDAATSHLRRILCRPGA
jgi:phosphonate transport system permease protein